MALTSSINTAFAHLKSSSNSVVFEALVVIRKFIAKNNQNVKVVREKKVLKDLISILGKPNEKNVDVALSILGNCCLDNETRNELFQLGVVKAVASVFNSTCRDAIQGRACRVIANLALTYNIAIKFHKENVIISLVNIVDCDGNNSMASQQMAVRALRVLWAVESERITMLELNVVRKVAMLLTTPYGKREEKDLLKTVVKALTVFTYHCSEQCAVQVHADSSVLEALLSYCSKDEIKFFVILCVFNLCHIGSSRPILGSAGVVEIIVEELSILNSQSAEFCESRCALISSLCILCRESVNRAKIRRAGGLPIILSILRDCPKSSLHTTALHALVLFIYDEMSLQELLKEGLVNVLVTKLSKFVKKHACEHEQQCNNSAAEISHEGKNEEGPPKKRHKSICSSSSKSKSDEESNIETSEKSKILETNQVSDPNSNSENWKRFRVSSPSYQAVVQEFGFIQRCREKNGSSSSVMSPTHSGEFLFRINSPEQIMGSDSYQMGDWSPGSPRSMCFSPESSPQNGRQWNYSPSFLQTSPFDVWSSTSSPVSQYSVDCEIPEVYSPVCHDAQSDEDECDENIQCGSAISHTSDEMIEEKTTKSPSVDCESPSANWEEISETSQSGSQHLSAEENDILTLISRISHMETVVEDLVLKNTLSTLLDYIRLIRNPLPRVGRILGRIVRTHHYFVHLISQQFVLDIYANLCQPLHSACSSCDKLNMIGKNLISRISIVAESGFGEGELSHNLLKAEKSIKEAIVITVPFVIKTHKLLRKLLIRCKGLDVLQYMVKSYSEEQEGTLMEHIPECLSLLAASLHVSNPVVTSQVNKYHSNFKLDVNMENVELSDRITVRFDNGDISIASKTFLTEHSPVFEAMLHGTFKESKQEFISLGDISSSAFMHLMYIMKLGKIPNYLPSLTLSIALELLLVLDRFLVPGSQDLSELIVQQYLQSSTAFNVYRNIMKYCGTLEVFGDLRIKTIEFLLVSDMSVEKRKNIFTELLKAPYSVDVQNDIFNILRKKLDTMC